jgi:hypothetical protein
LETVVLPLNYRPIGPIVAKKLLFGLLMGSGCPAPVAELFELDFARNKLLVLAGPVVNTLAFLALQFYEAVL